MQLRKIVLGLAAMTMLASCAKEITKAEAVEIAKGYDTANVIYKSGHGKSVTEVSFSANVPDALKEQYKGGTQEVDFKDETTVVGQRLTAAHVEAAPETAKFKADGKKLEMSYVLEQEHQRLQSTTYFDENGYPLGGNSEGTYTLKDGNRSFLITRKTSSTYTWVK